MDKYENMSYLELCEVRDNTKNPKELRKIHKVFKKNGYCGGVDFFDRYPYFPLIISIVALIGAYRK